MRFRSGELPVFLVTVRPTPGAPVSTGTICSVNPLRPARDPRATLRNCARFLRRRNWSLRGPAVIAASVLRGQALAAERAAAIENLAAVGSRHALAEAVAAGADKLARLVGTLHSFTPRRARSSW